MKVPLPLPIESVIGGGWDQLLAMMGVLGALSAAVTGGTLLWLRFRLRTYFVPRSDHAAMERDFEAKHTENTRHLVALEAELKTLATRHNLKGLEQRQDSLYAELVKVQVETARVSEKIAGVAESNGRVEHMMDLVLKQLMDRDPHA